MAKQTKQFENEKHRTKILDRIQKLLSTADGTQYEAEAATALKMAQGYMKSYGLSMTDIELEKDLQGQKIVEEILDEHASRQNPEKWEALLAIAVGIIFDCKSVRRIFYSTSKLIFIEYEKDVAMAKVVFTILYISCRAASVKLNPGGAGRVRLSFMYGCAERIYERAKKEKQEARKEPSGRYDLVVVSKNQLIKDWAKKNMDLRESRQRKVTIDAEAYSRGRDHGNNMDLMNREKVQKPVGKLVKL